MNATLTEKMGYTTDFIDLVGRMDTFRRILRKLQADGAPAPTHIGIHSGQIQWLLFSGHDHAQQKATAREVMRTAGGTWDKTSGSSSALFSFRQYRMGVELVVTVDRPAVCTRVVTAVEKVERHIPASPAVEAHTEVEEVETVEWRCEPVFGDAQEAAPA